jgi:hypothetical protein
MKILGMKNYAAGKGLIGLTLTLDMHVTTLVSPLESPSFTGYDCLVSATFAHCHRSVIQADR